MANDMTPLWKQHRGAPATEPEKELEDPQPHEMPTADGADEAVMNLVKGMLDGTSTPEQRQKANEFRPDAAFKAMEEPSILEQMHFGLKEAQYSDPDALMSTTKDNLEKYLIVEKPRLAARHRLRKATDDTSWYDIAWETMKEGLFTKDVQDKVDDQAFMYGAQLFKSKEKMASFEDSYIKRHYGEDWIDLTPDQRRSRMDEESNALLKEQFPTVYGSKYAHSGWAGLGNVGTALQDPLSYVAPAVKSYTAAWHVGSTYGMIDMVTKSLADKGFVTPAEVALGYGLGGVFGVGMRGVAKGTGKVWDKALIRSRNSYASKVIDKYEKTIGEVTRSGGDWNEAVMVARTIAKVDGPNLEQMYKTTGRSFQMEGGTVSKVMTDVEAKASWGFMHRAINGTAESLAPYITPIADVLQKKTPKVFQALRANDAKMHFRMHAMFEETRPWLEQVKNMSKPDKTQIKKWVMSGNHEDFRSATAMMKKYAQIDSDKFGDMFKNWTKVRSTLKRAADDYLDSGYDMKLIKDYFPRIARNPNKLNDAKLGWLAWQMEKKAKTLGRPLTEQDMGDLFKRAISMPERDLAKAPVGGHLRERIVPELNDYLEPHYADVDEALHSYFRVAARDIERANFFNKFSPKKRAYKVTGTDLDGADSSINDMMFGKDVVDDIANLGTKEREKIARILRTRFGSGESSPKSWIQTYKNLGYTLLLGNPLSAMTQLGDQAFSLYRYGVRNYLEALTLPQVISKESLGLTDAMEELFANTAKTKKLLDWSLKWSGFNKLDKFGKDMILNSAYRKYLRQVKTKGGVDDLYKSWGRFFEGDFDDLVKGLKGGDISNENVRLLLWHELADVQPIALSEMPEKYLASPNGRLFYMLKTFTIKQLSFMKRHIVDDFTKGNVTSGTKKLVGFTGLWLLFNGTADGLKSVWKDEKFDVEDNMVENLAQMTGFGKYTLEKGSREGPLRAMWDFISPPLVGVDDVAQAIATDDPKKALKALPWVGNILYQRIKNKEKRAKSLR